MMVQEFRARRDLLVWGLRDLGIACAMPEGAFYVFPDVPAFGGGCLCGVAAQRCAHRRDAWVGVWAWGPTTCGYRMQHRRSASGRRLRG